MADIIDRVARLLDDFEANGRKASRLLVGHAEAAEIERFLYRPAQPRRTEIIHGREFVWDEGEDEFAPKLPYPMTEAMTLFGVLIERVDQDAVLLVGAD